METHTNYKFIYLSGLHPQHFKKEFEMRLNDLFDTGNAGWMKPIVVIAYPREVNAGQSAIISAWLPNGRALRNVEDALVDSIREFNKNENQRSKVKCLRDQGLVVLVRFIARRKLLRGDTGRVVASLRNHIRRALPNHACYRESLRNATEVQKFVSQLEQRR